MTNENLHLCMCCTRISSFNGQFYRPKSQCSTVPVPEFIRGTGDIGDSGRLKYLKGMAGFCVCTATDGSSQCPTLGAVASV